MTHPAFLELLPAERVRLTLWQGTFLARRQLPTLARRNQPGSLQLYHIPNTGLGIFVELSFESSLAAIVIVRSCVDGKLLADYTANIKLPKGLWDYLP